MIGEQTGRALTLISGIETCKAVDPGFWQSVATRIVMDLDERGEQECVRVVADMLADVWNRLEDKREAATPESDGGEDCGCGLGAERCAAAEDGDLGG